MPEFTTGADAPPSHGSESHSLETVHGGLRISSTWDTLGGEAQRAAVISETYRILNGQLPVSSDILDKRHTPASDLIRCALVHSIRHKPRYSERPEIKALCCDFEDPRDAVFVRAHKARLIMSNGVPEILRPEHFPYCIWHPVLATQDTYRELAVRYPCMKYQIGRACAAGGYATLYKELDILPDVSIAEEARSFNNDEEDDIFQDIMAQPIRYAVLDDYTLTIRDVPLPNAHLNCDAALASTLTHLVAPLDLKNVSGRRFDINEDGGIGSIEPGSKLEREHKTCSSVSESEGGPTLYGLKPCDAWLLYSPLPADLPPIDKDVLILMAAHQGNIDRYDRLRRPRPIDLEYECVIRGIYHSTPFAKWWSLNVCQWTGHSGHNGILAAAHARFTMINDLSWITPDIHQGQLPYMIWYPVQPQPCTLHELLEREPRMNRAVAHASVACDYQLIYNQLKPKPTAALIAEAEVSLIPYYLDDLKGRQGEGGEPTTGSPNDERECSMAIKFKEPTSTFLHSPLQPSDIETTLRDKTVWEGLRVNGAAADLFMCSADCKELMQEVREMGGLKKLYQEHRS